MRKKKKESANRTYSLGPNLSFLDIVQDACSKGGRYTLTVEADGASYIVLVDRGGPFNVSGAGVTGSAALAMAAALRSGTYTVVEGWPVDQPLYQLGLDSTLKNLLLGSARTEMPDLPPARGVDSIRNAAWGSDPSPFPTPWNGGGGEAPETYIAPPTVPWRDVARPTAATGTLAVPTAAPPPPPGLPLPGVTPPAKFTRSNAPVADPTLTPTPAPTPQPPAAPIVEAPARATAPAPATAPEAAAAVPPPAVRAMPRPAQAAAPKPAAPVSPAPPTPVPAPGRAPEPSIRATLSGAATGSVAREMGFGEGIELDAAMPGEAGASAQQGPVKHLVTQALLWTVQIEEPGRYTLQQAWTLVLRALRSAFSVFIDPVEREVIQRWSRAKEDWRKSGESVAKQKSRKKSRTQPPE
jgi:hypothetical protein